MYTHGTPIRDPQTLTPSPIRSRHSPFIQTHTAATDVTPNGHGTRSLENGLGEAADRRGGGQLLRGVAGQVVKVLVEVDIALQAVIEAGRRHRGHRVAAGLIIVRHGQSGVAHLEVLAHVLRHGRRFGICVRFWPGHRFWPGLHNLAVFSHSRLVVTAYFTHFPVMFCISQMHLHRARSADCEGLFIVWAHDISDTSLSTISPNNWLSLSVVRSRSRL